MGCTENDLKSMGVRWRKKAAERSVWAVIPQETPVKL